MALQQSVTLPGEVVLATAYHRIQRTLLAQPTTEEPSFVVEVAVFRDSSARQAGVVPVAVVPVELPMPANPLGNLVEQGYEGLKASPAYQGALDV